MSEPPEDIEIIQSESDRIRWHLELETEDRPPSKVVEIAGAGSNAGIVVSELDDVAHDAVLRTLIIAPQATVAEVAQLCAMFSTQEYEVFARIEHVNGRPVAYLVREHRDNLPPPFLRHSSVTDRPCGTTSGSTRTEPSASGGRSPQREENL